MTHHSQASVRDDEIFHNLDNQLFIFSTRASIVQIMISPSVYRSLISQCLSINLRWENKIKRYVLFNTASSRSLKPDQ